MRHSSIVRPPVVLGLLVAVAFAVAPAQASAGEFRVASCQNDRADFSTTAFTGRASANMTLKRACNPKGPGMRGLITGNAVRRGTVKRGSTSVVYLSAPRGTHFTKLSWAGTAARRACSYSLQLFAERPGQKSVRIKNVQANKACPKPGRVQKAGFKAATYDITGATRIVQQVTCFAKVACSSRKNNYIRTFQASVGVVDDGAPSASIAADTALATGAWVGGTQLLNYDAEDTVGVSAAIASSGGSAVATDTRTCASATADAPAYTIPAPCPNGRGVTLVDTRKLVEGSQPLVVQAFDSAGNLGASAPVTVRVDNTPPGRTDLKVEGGDGWRGNNAFAITWHNEADADRAPIAGAELKVCPATGGACISAQQTGEDLERLDFGVPGPGEWIASVVRKDAAGNADSDQASGPVWLRYDPTAAPVAFSAASTSPTPGSVLVPTAPGPTLPAPALPPTPTPAPAPTPPSDGKTYAGPSLSAAVLIDAGTDAPIPGVPLITYGSVVSLDGLPTKNLNVLALSAGAGSVAFTYDGKLRRIENSAPFTMAGNNGLDYSSFTPTAGSHTLTIQAFTQDNRGGSAGRPMTVTLKLSAPSPSPTPAPTPAPAPTTPGSFAKLLYDDMHSGSEVPPHGVEYDWAYDPRVGAGTDANGDTAFTAWGQLFECVSGNPQPKARVEIRNLETWIKSKRTGSWTRVQDSTGVDGGGFREDYADNNSRDANAIKLGDGGTSVAVGGGFNYHFWPVSGRVTINPGDIADVIVTVRGRLAPGTFTSGSAPCYTMSPGGDYWESLRAVWNDYTTNREMGIGRFKRVDANWRLFTLSTSSSGTLPTPTIDSASELR